MADVKKVVEIEIDLETGDIKQLGKEVDKVEKGLEKSTKGAKGLSGGFKKVGTALKAAGIGLLIATLAKLVEVFKTNQGAIDGFQTGMNALTIAFKDFFKFIDNNLGTVIEYFKVIFEDPLGAMKSFGRSLKTEVLNRIKQLGESLGILGKAIKKFFLGDFDEAWTLAKESAVAAVDVITGEDGGLETLKSAFDRVTTSIVDYTKSILEAGAATVELQKLAELAEIQQQGLIEQYDREAEIQRQIRDDFTKSFAERIAANDLLGKILKEQNDEELKLIDIRQRALEDQLNKGLIPEFEAKKQLMMLDNERAEIAARVTGFESEQQLNKISLLKEEADIKQELADEELKRQQDAALKAIEIEQQKVAAIFKVSKASMGAIAQLAQSFAGKSEAAQKKAFQIEKAASISQTIIATIEGSYQAFKAMAGIPIVGPVLGGIAAAAAAASGAAAVANISKQKFGGGGGSVPTAGPRGGGGGTSSIPQFNTVGGSEVNQLSQSIADQNQAPVQAYVVANDVTSAQSLERNRKQQATFP